MAISPADLKYQQLNGSLDTINDGNGVGTAASSTDGSSPFEPNGNVNGTGVGNPFYNPFMQVKFF